MDSNATSLPPRSNAWRGVLAELYTLLVIALLFLGARIYVALRITHIFDAADITILIAMACLITNAVFCQLSVSYGVGQHLVYLANPEHDALKLRMLNTFFQVANVLTTLFTKISISFYILRIRSNRTLKWVLGIFMVLMALATIAVIAVLCISCIPLEALWNPSVKGACLPLQTVYIVSYVQSAFTILIDLGLTISPIVILWDIKIRRGRKVLIVSLMSLGLIATGSNAGRNAVVPGLTEPDFTYTMVPVIVLSTLEAFAGVIAACIPSCVPMFTQRSIKKQQSMSGVYYSRSVSTKRDPANSSDRSSIYYCTVKGPSTDQTRSESQWSSDAA